MEQQAGALGTSASLALRLGQAIFSTTSLLFMCFRVDFFTYTAFCYLVTVMGLVIPWSSTLALLDIYSVFIRHIPRQRRVLSMIIIGDWMLSFLSLGAACATASVTEILLDSERFCSEKACARYQLSASMAFLSWFLSFTSCLFNFWVLPSL